MIEIRKTITDLIISQDKNNTGRELLGNSLFYYCCGKDPSPVIAFGSAFQLYIYSDPKNSYKREMALLSRRIKKHGYRLMSSRMIQGRLYPRRIGVTMWLAPDNEPFCVAYFPYDAQTVFRGIYHDVSADGNYNIIQPKCICNYRYEFTYGSDPQYDADYFNRIEKRAEYVFGYCFNDKYKEIGEYKYYGDYEKHTKIKLYRRMYWYI